MSECPHISAPLMRWIEELVPEKSYDIKKSHDENVQYSGGVELVRRLKLEFKRQQNAAPPPSL